MLTKSGELRTPANMCLVSAYQDGLERVGLEECPQTAQSVWSYSKDFTLVHKGPFYKLGVVVGEGSEGVRATCRGKILRYQCFNTEILF